MSFGRRDCGGRAMSAAGGYFSPHFFAAIDLTEAVKAVQGDPRGFLPPRAPVRCVQIAVYDDAGASVLLRSLLAPPPI